MLGVRCYRKAVQMKLEWTCWSRTNCDHSLQTRSHQTPQGKKQCIHHVSCSQPLRCFALPAAALMFLRRKQNVFNWGQHPAPSRDSCLTCCLFLPQPGKHPWVEPSFPDFHTPRSIRSVSLWQTRGCSPPSRPSFILVPKLLHGSQVICGDWLGQGGMLVLVVHYPCGWLV